jgi:hypothetical protein
MKKFIIPLLLLISGSVFSQVAVGASRETTTDGHSEEVLE